MFEQIKFGTASSSADLWCNTRSVVRANSLEKVVECFCLCTHGTCLSVIERGLRDAVLSEVSVKVHILKRGR